MTSQRDLARLIESCTSETISPATVSNYLHGVTPAHKSFPGLLIAALDLSEEEKDELARAFAFGQEDAFNPDDL